MSLPMFLTIMVLFNAGATILLALVVIDGLRGAYLRGYNKGVEDDKKHDLVKVGGRYVSRVDYQHVELAKEYASNIIQNNTYHKAVVTPEDKEKFKKFVKKYS